MKVQKKALVVLAILASGLWPQQAQAQGAGSKEPVEHNQVISANPFLLLWEWTNVEYERKVTPTSTVGVAGSWISLDGGDESYKSLTGFYRYYPQGAALTGFYIGGRLGYHTVSDVDPDDEGNAFGFGVDVGYSWLLGSSRSFYIGLGIGATRLFGGDLNDDSVTLPSVRLLNVGIAF